MLLSRKFIILLLLLLPLTAAAQVEDALEQWVEEREGDANAAELNDLLLQLADAPVNLNDTAAIATLPFLSPFQIRSLRNYIQLYGQLLDVKELRMVPGFDSATVALLSPLVVTEPYAPDKSLSLGEMLAKGRHTVVSGMGGTVERAEGYDNGHYEGDNLRALFCYTYNYDNRISLRLSADKDPAEPWGKGNFYGYHLMISDFGRLEKLVLGRYNLQFGQGLTLWTGFEPFSLTGTSPVRYGHGIRPASAFYEEGWQQGLAARVNLGRGFGVSAFGSRAGDEWFGGGHLDYRRGNLLLGLTATATRLDDSLKMKDYAYNQTYFRGDRQGALGLDALWQAGRTMLFGEAAVDQSGKTAFLGGVRISAGNGNNFGVTLRRYDPLYHNLHAAAYAIGETRNEQGISLDAQVRLPLSVTALLSADLHRFPAPRYGSYTPSAGTWVRVQLERPFGRRVQAAVRYAWRQKQRNIVGSDSTLYLGEETLRRQLQGQVRVTVGNWRFTTRGILSWFDAEQAERQHGWLAAQEVRYGHGRWQFATQAACFNVEGYYARIYLNESNLQYAYSMPMLQNRGLRLSAVVRVNVSKWLRVNLKYAVSAYPGQEAVGSGDAATTGPARQTWHLQLRLNL